jgi:hypothetical protein
MDVVSSTRLDAPLLRGTRAADGAAGPCALAWGRLPTSGATPRVAFGGGRHRSRRQQATVLKVTSWCWLAAADGEFRQVNVWVAGNGVRARIRPGRP